MIGKRFPYRNLGFVTALDLLNSMPDVVQTEQLSSGHLLLYGVPEPSTEHLSRMVAVQKPNPEGYNRKTSQVLQQQDKRPFSSSGEHSESVPDRVTDKMKKVFRAIMANHPNGLPASQLSREYSKERGHDLDSKHFGCQSIVELCVWLQDVFTVIRGGIDGSSDDWVLYSADKVKPTKRYFNASPADPTKTSGFEPETAVPATDNTHVPVSEHIVSNVGRVLLRNPQGLPYQMFIRAYLDTTGENLDVERLGFHSLDMFLASLATRNILQVAHQGSHIIVAPILDKFKAYESIPRWGVGMSCDSKPTDALGPRDKISPQEIPTNLKVGDFLDVIVANVSNPNRFYVQLKGEETSKSLESLVEEMDDFYYGESAKRYKIPDPFVVVGLVCVSLLSDGNWNRCFVTSMKDLSTVEVYYIDFGNVLKVKKDSLYYLTTKFARLPGQAIQARLAGIKPGGGRSRYSKESSQRLMSLVKASPAGHVAVIRGFGERLSLWLVDTSTNDLPEGIAINQALVDEGLAESDGMATQSLPSAHSGENIPTNIPALRNENKNKEKNWLDSEDTSPQQKYFNKGKEDENENVGELESIRPVWLAGQACHVVNKHRSAWMASHQISLFIPNWKGKDLLFKMLALKRLSVPSLTVTEDSDPTLYSSMKAVLGDATSHQIIMYSLKSLSYILNMFLQEPELRAALQSEIHNLLIEGISEDTVNMTHNFQDLDINSQVYFGNLKYN